MAKGSEVLSMLIPTGGWVISGDEFENIKFIDCEPITKKEFADGFAKYDAWKSKEEQKIVEAKLSAEAKLAALGISVDDLKALGLA